MAEAIQLVKTTMGNDAVILHTRTYPVRQWLGLRRREMVEVTAGRGVLFARWTRQPAAAAPAGVPARVPVGANHAGVIYGPGASTKTAVQPAVPSRNPIENARQLMDTPAAGNALIRSVGKDMADLKQMVEKLVNENRKILSPKVPEELFDHYTQLISNEVAEELAQELIRTLHRDLRPEYLSQEKYVREKLTDLIERLIPSSGPIVRKRATGPHVLALIGPTGVGKTTTLAKLAANLKMKEGHSVGLITLDTYRIAAMDQLKRYGDLMRAPVRVVGGAEEMRSAMDSMQGLDFVFIDTAGRSPNDTMKLNELRDLLDVISPDEVHLVLSSTSAPACIDLAVKRFSEVRVDKIIFTKLDEAAHVGVVLNVIRKVNKSLSYVTTGQQVPKDIEVGHGRTVARMILGENTGGVPGLLK